MSSVNPGAKGENVTEQEHVSADQHPNPISDVRETMRGANGAVNGVRADIGTLAKNTTSLELAEPKIPEQNISAETKEVLYRDAVIFTADDDALLARAFLRLMKNYKHVQSFSDGQYLLEALNEIQSPGGFPHLIISDIQMPRLSGTDLYREVSKLDTAVRPQFVAMTGNWTRANIGLLADEDVQIIEKPFQVAVLHDAVANALLQHPKFRHLR